MSYEKMLGALGVHFHHKFSPIKTNWIVEAEKLKQSGNQFKIHRLGGKRVVLALEQEDIKSRTILVPTIALVTSAVALLPMLNQQKSEPTMHSQKCEPIKRGQTLQNNAWKFSLTTQQKMGNLESLSGTASCGGEFWAGNVLISKTNLGEEIKKLTPTK